MSPLVYPMPRTKTREERVAEVRTALLALDAVGSGYAIALYLHDNGIRGCRTSCTGCPVATYVFVMTGNEIALDGHRWEIQDDTDFIEFRPVPPNVSTFIHDFDNGHYSNLRTSV